MKRFPNKIDAYELHKEWSDLNTPKTSAQVEIDGVKKWVPGRHLGYPSFWSRCKLGWAVFTGRADALFWKGQEEN